MTPSELRAAAERIKRIRAGAEKSQDIYGVLVRRDPTRMESIEAGNKVKRRMLDDERALVDYAIESLATVRADDGEQEFDGPWLHAMGFTTKDGHMWTLRDKRMSLTVRVAPFSTARLSFDATYSGTFSTYKKPRTRDDIRKIVDAIGFETFGQPSQEPQFSPDQLEKLDELGFEVKK